MRCHRQMEDHKKHAPQLFACVAKLVFSPQQFLEAVPNSYHSAYIIDNRRTGRTTLLRQFLLDVMKTSLQNLDIVVLTIDVRAARDFVDRLKRDMAFNHILTTSGDRMIIETRNVQFFVRVSAHYDVGKFARDRRQNKYVRDFWCDPNCKTLLIVDDCDFINFDDVKKLFREADSRLLVYTKKKMKQRIDRAFCCELSSRELGKTKTDVRYTGMNKLFEPRLIDLIASFL